MELWPRLTNRECGFSEVATKASHLSCITDFGVHSNNNSTFTPEASAPEETPGPEAPAADEVDVPKSDN